MDRPLNSECGSATQVFRQENLWLIHSYYTLCPWAPDGSGRLLVAGVDLESEEAEVLVLAPDGSASHRFGRHKVQAPFYHTGFWQTWSPDSRYVYFQKGSVKKPLIARYCLETGKELTLPGDFEGAPPKGEPIIGALMGMLYCARGTEEGLSRKESPVPFQARDRHGLFTYTFEPESSRLFLSVQQVLDEHPHRDRILKMDAEMKARLGKADGLSLMLYCVRWNAQGTRMLFYFGNHNAFMDESRGEPKVSHLFTAKPDLSEMHLAVDLTPPRQGLHWSWHPDGEHLIGYGSDPENKKQLCLAQARYDGSGYRKMATHATGGHPSICPTDWNLLVTDTYEHPGKIQWIDLERDEIVREEIVMHGFGAEIPAGRSPQKIDTHPVWSHEGKRVLVNSLEGRFAELRVFEV